MSMAIGSKANVSSEDDEELDEEPGEAIESAPPLKVGEEREISNSGLKKKLIKRGVGWETPEFGYEVTVHYVGTLLDGTKFESTREGDQPLTFKLGHGEVAKGLAMGIVTMKKGEIALFTVPSDMGYGSAGRDGVPANSIVQFEVELISWITVVDVTKDGGIIKRILEQGNSDRQPSELDEVLVRYQIMRPNGSIVAETPKEGKSFYIKDGHMIPALPKAIKTMKVGEKANLNVQSQYWCNDLDRKANDIFSSIPQTSSLSINLELMSLKPVIDVCGDSKVIKKILEEGESLVAADKGAAVTGEAIDALLAMKGKLTKEEKRHLDDARRDKQVKEHAVQQVQELPPVCSASRPRKPGLSQRLPPLKLFCPTPHYIVYALESQTKSDLLDRTPTPARPARVSGVQPPSGPGGSSGGSSSRPPTKKRRAPLSSTSPSDSLSLPSSEKKGLFFSAKEAGKMAMIDEFFQLWGLPPHLTPAGMPSNLDEAQIRFMEGSALCLSVLRSVPAQRVSEAELQTLRESIMHLQKELASYKERSRTDGRRIRELEDKMKDMERRFEADQALLESNFHTTLLKSVDSSFEAGRKAMASLYSEAAHEFDGGKGVFLPDWEVLLRWVNVLEQRKANEHARQKEELRQEVLRSCAEARSRSPVFVPEDPPEEEAGEEQAEDEVVDEEDA